MIAQFVFATTLSANTFCGGLAEFAGVAMQLRQSNIPLHVATEWIEPGPEELLLKAVLEEAYRQPQAPEHLQREVRVDYQNAIYLGCVEATR